MKHTAQQRATPLDTYNCGAGVSFRFLGKWLRFLHGAVWAIFIFLGLFSYGWQNFQKVFAPNHQSDTSLTPKCRLINGSSPSAVSPAGTTSEISSNSGWHVVKTKGTI